MDCDPHRIDTSGRSELAAGLKQGVLIAAAVLAVTLPPAGFSRNIPSAAISASGALGAPASPHHSRQPTIANFRGLRASAEAVHVANWVADSGDNQRLPFVVIDKTHAQVYVFDASASLIGSTPVLLGAASGDVSVAGIGQRPIHDVRPEERTTPAGRFITEPGRNAQGEDVIWVDYDAAVSMHRVRATDPRERRLQRLASETTADNRISYGCINMPVAFFEGVVSPTFRARHGVAYVLPETLPVQAVFNSYDLKEKYGADAMARAERQLASS